MKKAAKRLRVYCNTNAPWSTSGYGTQANELFYKWSEEGYPTALGCFYGLQGSPIEINNVKMYPRMGSDWGEDGMVMHAKDFNADVTFSLQDIWTMDLNLLKQVKRWVPIVPIDHEPVPRAVLERLRLSYRIVTYSQFGQKELEKAGLASTYIPHTVDTKIFKPMDKTKLRKDYGIPEDIFLFGMVSANKDMPPRKSFQEALDAFNIFHKLHPKSGIFFSTIMQQHGGFDIVSYANYLGIGDCVYSIDPYIQMFKIDRVALAGIMAMFDCLLCPSLNEGFGVPIIEAQALGVPAIVNNCTAMPELVIPGRTGEVCELIPGPSGRRWTTLNSYVGVPDTRSLYDKMEKIYRYNPETSSKAARKFIVENYDTEKVVKEKWFPFLEKVEKEVYRNVDKEKSL